VKGPHFQGKEASKGNKKMKKKSNNKREGLPRMFKGEENLTGLKKRTRD